MDRSEHAKKILDFPPLTKGTHVPFIFRGYNPYIGGERKHHLSMDFGVWRVPRVAPSLDRVNQTNPPEMMTSWSVVMNFMVDSNGEPHFPYRQGGPQIQL